MPEDESFIAFEKEGGLFWRSQSGEPKQIGITMKVANQLQEALTFTIEERDKCRTDRETYLQKLIDNGLYAPPKTPEDIATEALLAAKAAEQNMTSMAKALSEQGEMLRVLLAERQSVSAPMIKPDPVIEQAVKPQANTNPAASKTDREAAKK